MLWYQFIDCYYFNFSTDLPMKILVRIIFSLIIMAYISCMKWDTGLNFVLGWAKPWIDGFSVPKTCFCLGPSNATSESCCILCMSSTLKSQATRWSHRTHADHIVTRLSSKLNWACVFFPQCDMRVKFSLDVSKFEIGIGVDATSPSAKDQSS